LHLDFETSGLNVFANHIVELGVLSEHGEYFSTVCCPPMLTPGPRVHGIANDELLAGLSFSEAFRRMVVFVHALLLNSVQSDSSSEEELAPTRFKDHAPDVVLIAHNGSKVDIPFLFSEYYRNSVVWEDLATWKCVDSLDVARALHLDVYGGCQKLQCLLQRVDCCDLQCQNGLVSLHRMT
jgi:DNA polymerase III alpha subunit (gram-positive type)